MCCLIVLVVTWFSLWAFCTSQEIICVDRLQNDLQRVEQCCCPRGKSSSLTTNLQVLVLILGL